MKKKKYEKNGIIRNWRKKKEINQRQTEQNLIITNEWKIYVCNLIINIALRKYLVEKNIVFIFLTDQHLDICSDYFFIQ